MLKFVAGVVVGAATVAAWVLFRPVTEEEQREIEREIRQNPAHEVTLKRGSVIGRP